MSQTVKNCQSCGAPIFFAATGTGKRIPLDAEPTEDGNIVILDGEACVIPKGTYLAGKPQYRSHFATCPNAARHRRRS